MGNTIKTVQDVTHAANEQARLARNATKQNKNNKPFRSALPANAYQGSLQGLTYLGKDIEQLLHI